jgi:anti-sigma factor RsiW
MVDHKAPVLQHSCSEPDIGNLFPFYLSGNVTPEQRRRVDQHISECRECREELRFFATVRSMRIPKRIVSPTRAQKRA